MSFFKTREFFLILLSAVLFAIAYPPSPLSFTAYFALVPLFFLIESASPRQAFKYCYTFGVLTNILLLYWIIWQSFYGEYFVLPGAIAAYFILALYPALWGWLLAQIRLRWKPALILAPFLWVSLEYVRGSGQIGFPWLDFGYTQTNYLPMIQFASLTGIYGVSLWLVALNLLFYCLVKSRSSISRASIYGLSIVILLLIPYFYGERQLKMSKTSEEIKVALVQGNIDPNTKWAPEFLDYNFQIYDSLTREAAKAEPDLAIWPETAAPCYLEKEPLYLKRVENLAGELNMDIVTGTDDYIILGPDRYVFYNAAFEIQPDSGLVEKYYKMQLVPFAERIPYSGNMRIFEKLELGQANFSPGQDFTMFECKGNRFAPLICYEIVFPDVVRQFVKRSADFLVNITNDAWFGRTAGPYQHASMSVMRAVENRISIARCANSGISQAVDPWGRITAKTSLFQRTNLIAKIPMRAETTFFTRHGPWLALLCLGFTALALIFVAIKRFLQNA